jgi:CheY-like chemotaxis protein
VTLVEPQVTAGGVDSLDQRTEWIFVIEDNEADLFLLKESLRREGLNYDVVASRDGSRAIEFLACDQAAANPPDCILLDLNLPGAPGDQVFKAIRNHPHLAEVPVLIWSSQIRGAPVIDSPTRTFFFEKSCKLHEFLTIGSRIRDLLQESKGRTARHGSEL